MNDAHFNKLLEYINNKDRATPSEITAQLGMFRKSLSRNWLKHIYEKNPNETLALVIRTLLYYTENENANVRITTYSTLGALLLTIAPFDPRLFINSFGNAISKIKVSPKSSIAIINMFVFLSRYVSPVQIQKFIIVVPVHEHFKADVSDFLQFLPNIIPMMSKIPPTFRESILTTIINGCSNTPNTYYTSSIYSLVSIDKKNLLPKMHQLLKPYPSAMLAIGPTLLSDNEIYNLLGENGRKIYCDLSLAEIQKEKPKYMEYECACHILEIIRRRSKSPEIEQVIIEAMNRDLGPQYIRLQLILPISFDKIFNGEANSDSLRSARLSALGTFILDYPDKADMDIAAKIFFDNRETKNDLFCTLIESFGKCINTLLSRCKQDYHIRLLKFLLEKGNNNWVQDMATTGLIAGLDVSLVRPFIPDITRRCVVKLLAFSNSPNRRLSEAANDALCRIASYRILDRLICEIAVSDWADEFIATRRFELLGRLAALFQSDGFQQFVPIAYECITACESMAALTMIFSFLQHVPVDFVPPAVLEFCFGFIRSAYESFTQTKIDNIWGKPNEDGEVPPQTFIESYDTDIVSNPSFDHKHILKPIQSCFEFLCHVEPSVLRAAGREEGQATSTLFWYSIVLIPLFDEDALERAATLNKDLLVEHPKLWTTIEETFLSTSREEVAARCCKIFVESGKKLSQDVMLMAEKYLIEQQTTNPDLLFYCFVLIDMYDHEKALCTLPTMQRLVGPKDGTPLLFRLTQVLGRPIVSFVEDEFVLALLLSANNGEPNSIQRVTKYVESVPFEKWPIGDKSLNDELVEFLSKREPLTIVSLDELKKEHWMFVLENPKLFVIDNLVEYVFDHQKIFGKIKTAPIPPSRRRSMKFTYKPVEGVTLAASMSPSVANNEIIRSVPIIESFLRFSKEKLNSELADQILDFLMEMEDNKTIKLLIRKCIEDKIQLNREKLMTIRDEELIGDVIEMLHLNPMELPPEIDQIVKSALPPDPLPIDYIRAYDKPFIPQLIGEDPKYFLEAFITEEFRTSNYRALCNLVQRVNFDGIQLHDLLLSQINNIGVIESLKKKCTLLRFASVCLAALRSRKLSFEVRLIASMMYAQMDLITECSAPCYINELATFVSVFTTSSPQTEQFVSFISTITKQIGSSWLFIVPASYLKTMKGHTLGSLRSDIFLGNIELEIPSISSRVLRALQYFISKSCKRDEVELAHAVLPIVSDRIEYFSTSFRTASELVPFIVRLIHSNKEGQSETEAVRLFRDFFLCDHRQANFTLAIPVVPHLISVIPEAGGLLFRPGMPTELLADAISECFSGHESEVYRNAIDLFNASPSIELGEILIEFATKVENTVELSKHVHGDSNIVRITRSKATGEKDWIKDLANQR